MPTSCRDSSRPGSTSGSTPAANWSRWRGPIAFRGSSASVPSATSSPPATTATAAWPRPQPRRSPRSSSASAVRTSCSTCATATRSPTSPTSGLASSTTAPSSKASSTAGPAGADVEEYLTGLDQVSAEDHPVVIAVRRIAGDQSEVVTVGRPEVADVGGADDLDDVDLVLVAPAVDGVDLDDVAGFDAVDIQPLRLAVEGDQHVALLSGCRGRLVMDGVEYLEAAPIAVDGDRVLAHAGQGHLEVDPVRQPRRLRRASRVWRGLRRRPGDR